MTDSLCSVRHLVGDDVMNEHVKQRMTFLDLVLMLAKFIEFCSSHPGCIELVLWMLTLLLHDLISILLITKTHH